MSQVDVSRRHSGVGTACRKPEHAPIRWAASMRECCWMSNSVNTLSHKLGNCLLCMKGTKPAKSSDAAAGGDATPSPQPWRPHCGVKVARKSGSKHHHNELHSGVQSTALIQLCTVSAELVLPVCCLHGVPAKQAPLLSSSPKSVSLFCSWPDILTQPLNAERPRRSPVLRVTLSHCHTKQPHGAFLKFSNQILKCFFPGHR